MVMARRAAKLTQVQAAELVGVSQSTLAGLEMEAQGSGYTVQFARVYACDPDWLASGNGTPPGGSVAREPEVEYAGRPARARRIPVVGTARMGADGFFEELVPGSEGSIDSYSTDPDAYALRLKGDSMHPAIRNGSFVVVEPNGRCTPGEYVALQLVDGRKMVKELIFERQDEVVVESVNGNARMTIARADIESMHPVAAVVAASKWRPA